MSNLGLFLEVFFCFGDAATGDLGVGSFAGDVVVDIPHWYLILGTGDGDTDCKWTLLVFGCRLLAVWSKRRRR